MRAILIVLVLVNLAWAVWAGALRDDPVAGRLAQPPRTVGPGLALLSELPPEAIGTAESAPEEVAGAALEQPAEPVAAAAEPKESDAAVEQPPERVAAEVKQPVLDGALASLNQPEVSTDKPQNCLAMGPFDELAQVEALRDEILADGGSAEIVSEEMQGRPDYLVFIYTTGSRAVARRIREELQGQTIDSHIIAGGDLENTLSVGVFSREPLARRQYDRVIALGYEAAVRELARQQTVYHLMADRAVADPTVPGRAACHEIAAAHTF